MENWTTQFVKIHCLDSADLLYKDLVFRTSQLHVGAVERGCVEWKLLNVRTRPLYIYVCVCVGVGWTNKCQHVYEIVAVCSFSFYTSTSWRSNQLLFLWVDWRCALKATFLVTLQLNRCYRAYNIRNRFFMYSAWVNTMMNLLYSRFSM